MRKIQHEDNDGCKSGIAVKQALNSQTEWLHCDAWAKLIIIISRFYSLTVVSCLLMTAKKYVFSSHEIDTNPFSYVIVS